MSAQLVLPDAVEVNPSGWVTQQYAPGDRASFVWTIVWDTPQDAERFARAYAQAAVRRFPGPARLTTALGRFGFERAGRHLDLRWSADRVEIRENLDPAGPHGEALGRQ